VVGATKPRARDAPSARAHPRAPPPRARTPSVERRTPDAAQVRVEPHLLHRDAVGSGAGVSRRDPSADVPPATTSLESLRSAARWSLVGERPDHTLLEVTVGRVRFQRVPTESAHRAELSHLASEATAVPTEQHMHAYVRAFSMQDPEEPGADLGSTLEAVEGLEERGEHVLGQVIHAAGAESCTTRHPVEWSGVVPNDGADGLGIAPTKRRHRVATEFHGFHADRSRDASSGRRA